MSTTKTSTGKVNRSFQITVPKKYRKVFNIDIGDVIEFDLREDGILVRPLDLLRRQAVKRIEELGKIHVDDELSNLSENELMRVVNEQIQEVRTEKKKNKTRRRS
ncbi:MAG: AbrB/MazE/SpoVT family DNA-binding domain-containing protein [Nitrospinae bacterium]|nr:AbrB/MazE/SpoVT family DNA-binding domain-containing protein [Nitrospinota bacterium]